MDPAKRLADLGVTDRIRAHLRERGISMRQLSREAGLDETAVGKLLERIPEGGDVGAETLLALSRAMGKPLLWLIYGQEPPPSITLDELPDWSRALDEAVTTFGVDRALAEQAGRWFRVHDRPTRLDGVVIAALTQAFRASQRQTE